MNLKIKFGLIALIIILFQSSIKIIGVMVTGSLSFLSETVDTLTDIFFVSLTLYSLYISQKPPDYKHMYGHSKVDAIGAMIQGIILINLYIFLIINAIQVLIAQSYTISNPNLGFQILIISFLVNLVFSRILIWQGKKHKSLSLKIQGINLFQDSLRAILVLVNFVLVLFFEIHFLDPIFSIVLSSWIIIHAIKLTKEGISELVDSNPINALIIEKIKQNIFQVEHVNGVEEIRVRASGNTLFFEAQLSVEDHISVVHANEITKTIHSMIKTYFSSYNVEIIVEMNPLSGESSIGKNILNLLDTMKSEFTEIMDFRNLNVFRIEDSYFLSVAMVVSDNLTLDDAHDVSIKFEEQLKEQVPVISRIITHLESEKKVRKLLSDQLICEPIDPQKKIEIENKIEDLLGKLKFVKGYHGLEFWTVMDYCVLELHVFFDGSLNISEVHEIISDLEYRIINELKIENLKEVILHSEPQGERSSLP